MFRQRWWVIVAAALAGLQALFAVTVEGAFEVHGTARTTLLIAVAALALLALIGIVLRPRLRRLGDALIAVGVVPSTLAPLVGYWFPPVWLIAGAALAVIIMATRDGLDRVGVAVP